MKNVVLFDADWLLHSLCHVTTTEYCWCAQQRTYYINIEGGHAYARAFMAALARTCYEEYATNLILFAFSDPDRNWRKEIVDPSYKSNRRQKPQGFAALYHWLTDQGTHSMGHGVPVETRPVCVPGWEADDIIGVIATGSPIANLCRYGCVPNTQYILSPDKDLRTIPGEHICFKSYRRFIRKTEHITPADAEYNFLSQVLTGDAVDGYAGIPGVGPKRAAKLLRDPHVVFKDDNCGQWLKRPLADGETLWTAIVSWYERAGLTAGDALRNARLAHILQAGDVNSGDIRLWQPGYHAGGCYHVL